MTVVPWRFERPTLASAATGSPPLRYDCGEAAAVAVDLELELGRQGVHDRHAHAVEAARHLVAAAAELAAGVQRGEHDLGGRRGLGCWGWSPTGMPRPSSLTRQAPSASTVTSMRVQAPAMASSTALSTTSHTRWCRPVGPVDPMYMPGRRRTASRPSRTVMESASYRLGSASGCGRSWARPGE